MKKSTLSKNVSDTKFTGLSPKMLTYFRQLERNNNKPWFAEHRSEYLQYVAEPMKRLALELAPVIQELDPKAATEPRRTVSRIYRDTRFAGDKTPYRPNVWIAFKRNIADWTKTPVYFFEVTGAEYFFGMGMYLANAATMRNFRRMIDADPQGFAEMIEPVNRSRLVSLVPEQYKRPLPCGHPAGVKTWYQSKTIAVIGTRAPDKTLFSPKIIDFITARFVLLKPLYDYLWKAVTI
ncbi:MAG: DUF2461 domain-containing protein [Planctomycetaceae bacterium]|jgi:uncharacterized protein (TIGR02453 family)|nr:DUF2461 domain-containing protein [Planctomycetaceae bacterium]